MSNFEYELQVLRDNDIFSNINQALSFINSYKYHKQGQILAIRYYSGAEVYTLLSIGKKDGDGINGGVEYYDNILDTKESIITNFFIENNILKYEKFNNTGLTSHTIDITPTINTDETIIYENNLLKSNLILEIENNTLYLKANDNIISQIDITPKSSLDKIFGNSNFNFENGYIIPIENQSGTADVVSSTKYFLNLKIEKHKIFILEYADDVYINIYKKFNNFRHETKYQKLVNIPDTDNFDVAYNIDPINLSNCVKTTVGNYTNILVPINIENLIHRLFGWVDDDILPKETNIFSLLKCMNTGTYYRDEYVSKLNDSDFNNLSQKFIIYKRGESLRTTRKYQRDTTKIKFHGLKTYSDYRGSISQELGFNVSYDNNLTNTHFNTPIQAVKLIIKSNNDKLIYKII